MQFFLTSFWKNRKMDIYKCPKSEIQKNFPNKNLNILNNKLEKILKDQILKFIYFIIIYMNQSEVFQESREYINEISHNGSLSDDLVNRLNMYIRANTILIGEDNAYNTARFLFRSFRENATDRDKIRRLNNILNDMADYLEGIRDETEPQEHENLDQVVNDIYALIRNNNGNNNGTNNVNEQNNVPYNTQGGKRRRGKKSKRKSRQIRRKRTRRYRR